MSGLWPRRHPPVPNSGTAAWTEAFEAKLRADGFGEIEAKALSPRPANHEHGHDHTVRGLVLSGAFTVICGGSPRTYRPGEIFEVAKGVEHSEQIGSEGAEVVIGRKY